MRDNAARIAILNMGLVVLIVLLGIASLLIGQVHLPFGDIVGGVYGSAPEKSVTIIQQLRLPRTLLALLAGGGLGLAGAVLQGFLRNPLADPSVVGISTAGSLGAVVAIYFGIYAASSWVIPLSAMSLCALATIVLYIIAARNVGTLTLLLAGIAINSVCLALISLSMNLSSNPYAVSEMVFWLLGSVSNRTLFDLGIAAPFVIAGILILLRSGKVLDAMSLGEEVARSLGIAIQRERLLLIGGVACVVGGVVSVAGGIGFVGLVVPHLMRPLAGHLPSRILLPSMLGGAVLLLAADIVVRLMANGPELQLGVLTSLIGAPFFFYLIVRRKALSDE
ncbi:MAG TPA: iron ABC transporter permease [Rhizomicrobium sp.]|jgi:iron complex transport system permease protein